CLFCFFFQAEDGIRDDLVTGVQTCALPILPRGDESKGAYGHFFLIGRAAPRPDVFLEGTKQADARAAHGSKLLGEARECPLAKRSEERRVGKEGIVRRARGQQVRHYGTQEL